MYKISDKNFVDWLKYGKNVMPFFDYRLMRDFCISQADLTSWFNGRCPNQNVRHAVIDWLKADGFKKS